MKKGPHSEFKWGHCDCDGQSTIRVHQMLLDVDLYYVTKQSRAATIHYFIFIFIFIIKVI